MRTRTVRINEIEITNFKNVKYGKITFKKNDNRNEASILGLYGQNGSGKTALVDAIMLLKYALTGQTIPQKYTDYINVESNFSMLRFNFLANNISTGVFYDIIYEFKIRKEQDDNWQNIATVETEKAVIYDEILSASYEINDKKCRMSEIINTSVKDVFEPKTKYLKLVGGDQEITTKLLVAKRLAYLTSRSFVFSKELLTIVNEKCTDAIYRDFIKMLVEYGNYELFVVSTRNTGLITMNALPLPFRYERENQGVVGNIMLSLDEAFTIPKNVFEIIEKLIPNMNLVLKQIIPGLTISMYNFGDQALENGSIGCRVQFMSKKNSKEIPLRYESDGIKKIVSILQLLIVVYNNDSITVAIDELDAGIFEYLLGEILRIISEKGKGQLIFTSHNLRPLETLNKDFIVFTTTNPKNRYIRMVNVKGNNNLRDFYYRDIVLGEQNEMVYEPTNNHEIALAFREASNI